MLSSFSLTLSSPIFFPADAAPTDPCNDRTASGLDWQTLPQTPTSVRRPDPHTLPGNKCIIHVQYLPSGTAYTAIYEIWYGIYLSIVVRTKENQHGTLILVTMEDGNRACAVRTCPLTIKISQDRFPLMIGSLTQKCRIFCQKLAVPLRQVVSHGIGLKTGFTVLRCKNSILHALNC